MTKDQAATLRQMFQRPIPVSQSNSRGLPASSEVPNSRGLPTSAVRERRCRSIAVSSGKGGVGKTSLVVNLAVVLSRLGVRVVIVDADLGLANADVMMGLRPRYTLADTVAGRRSLEEVLTEGPLGITLLPGASGLSELSDLQPAQRDRLIQSLTLLEERADVLLIDTGAGIGSTVRGFVAAAQELIVVTTPEPTAIADAYALIKVVHGQSPYRQFRLLVNQAASREEASETARKIICVAREFLSLEVGELGFVPRDAQVSQAVMRQMPVVLAYPHSPAAQALANLGRGLLREDASMPEQAESGGWVTRLSGLIERGL